MKFITGEQLLNEIIAFSDTKEGKIFFWFGGDPSILDVRAKKEKLQHLSP